MARISQPTAARTLEGAQAGIHNRRTVTASEVRKVSEGLDQMRSRERKSSWLRAALVLVGLVVLAAPVAAKPGPGRQGNHRNVDKLDNELKARSGRLLGTSRVIITLKPGHDQNASQEVRKVGGRLGRRLRLIDGLVVELPNRVIKQLAERPEILSIHYDRPLGGQMNRTSVSTGARLVQQQLGYKGAGIGVAVIDSGITDWHDDLTPQGTSPNMRSVNGQRVTAFVDFVAGLPDSYDDNGHGTHVSGIIAGNGYDTYGSRAGIAPAAHIVSLKVLDRYGRGVISDVIAAFEWAVDNRTAHNIRVINLSVGARVTESYMTDPLTLAAKGAVDRGVVVVTAAGNLGQKTSGGVTKTQYGGITAPCNAPWVLCVGAYSTEGTTWRWDDKIAPYSSRGPGAIDHEAKPDLVAPGTGVVSLSESTSEFYLTKAAYLLNGSRPTATKPYLSLSGTSMSSPVVAGTVILMLQANPALTPNLVKAILQYTAQTRHYDALTQGAGFLNAEGAVQLARYFRYADPGDLYPHSWMWSRQIIWGNYRLKGGVIKPNASAWAQNIVWGTAASDGENIVWGTLCGDSDCNNIVWGTAAEEGENIVWGTLQDGENIVWGTAADGENIVWGTAALQNIVWGTACGDSDCENIVWGTAMDLRNIVWGTLDNGENIVWGTNFDLENIVWGTSGVVDETVWGSAAEGEDVTWGSNGGDAELFDDPAADPVDYELATLEELFSPPPPPPAETPVTSTPVTLTPVTIGGGL
jgi:serine protease AprX